MTNNSGLFILIISLFIISCNKKGSHQQENPVSEPEFNTLYAILPEPQPGEWRYEHHEAEQSVTEFVNDLNNDSGRSVIYIVRIGYFDERQKQISDRVKTFLSAWFNKPVVELNSIPVSSIPSSDIRLQQLRSGYILDSILIPALPADALGLMAITTADLYPSDEWNFVFGEANTQQRVGVSSMFRYGDPNTSEFTFNLCAKRFYETAVHEFCHMLSIHHCKTWSCVMNGSNSLEEADKKPLLPCPLCLEKLNLKLNESATAFFMRVKPLLRMVSPKESEFCEHAIQILGK